MLNEQQLPQHIVDTLFKLYPNGKIKPVTKITQGASGASVHLVQIVENGAAKREKSPFYEGLAFAKIDSRERCEREHRKYATAHQGKISQYLPAILCEPIGPVEDWSLNLYQVAQNSLQRTRLLSQLIREHHPCKEVVDQVSRLLNTVLACWHGIDHLINYSETHTVPNLFNELINIGEKERISYLEQRTRNYFGVTRHNTLLMFRPGNVILPNPIAYVLNPKLWDTAASIVVPRSATHGDLHGGNIICHLERKNADPWLIDLAQFENESIPFFDLAYLELNMLLASIPVNNDEAWKNWLHLTKHLASGILPEDDPHGDRAFYAWNIVQPIRKYLSELLEAVGKKSKNLDEHFEAAWWVSAVAAGVLVGRRSRVLQHGDRLAALLYAAYAQQRLNHLFQFEMSSQKPVDIEFSSQYPITNEPASEIAHHNGNGHNNGHTNGHELPTPPPIEVTPEVSAPTGGIAAEVITQVVLPQSGLLAEEFEPEPAVPALEIPDYPEYYVGTDLIGENFETLKIIFDDVFREYQLAIPVSDGKSRLVRKWQRISLAKFCVFNAASHDPDSLIELGIALSRNRPMILIREKNTAPSIPLPMESVITYENAADLKMQLAQLMEKGFPFKAPTTNFCHFCKRVCDAFSTPPLDNVGLALNNSKLLWHPLNRQLAPYFQRHESHQMNLTDIPVHVDLCEVRRMALACQFAVAHLGTLASDTTYFSLGAVMGVPTPWLLLRTRTDSIPSNLQGLDILDYTTLENLHREQGNALNTFFETAGTPLEKPVAKTRFMQTAPLWEELKKSHDRTISVNRKDEKGQGRLQIVWYEDERFRSKHLIFREGLVFGRDPEKCNVALLHRNVSAQHFRVFQDRNDKYYIEDLNSKNGVQFNGVRLLANKKTEIGFKDVIRIDGTRFKLQIWDESPLPEDKRPDVGQTASLKTPFLEITIPEIKPPENSGKIDYRCILDICPPGNNHLIKLEVQSYYPMGRILTALRSKLGFKDLKYCFMLRNTRIDDTLTPLHLGIGEQDIFNIVLDPLRN